jgi:hypothetical protein
MNLAEMPGTDLQERGSSATRLCFRTLEAAELVPRAGNLFRTRRRCEAMSDLVQRVPTSMQEWLKGMMIVACRLLFSRSSAPCLANTASIVYDIITFHTRHADKTAFVQTIAQLEELRGSDVRPGTQLEATEYEVCCCEQNRDCRSAFMPNQ